MDEHEVLRLRRELYGRLPVAAVGYSADGRHVNFAGPVELGLRVGDLAVVERVDDSSVVVQVHDAETVEREGAQVDLATEHGGQFDSMRARLRLRAVNGDAVVLGRLAGETYEPVASVDAFGECAIRSATAAEVGVIATATDAGMDTMEIGSWRQAPTVPARLRSKGFARHTFMCGQSGSGKTYTTGVLFERLLAATTLPIVVLDPNSDHVLLGDMRDHDDPSPAGQRYRAVAGDVRTVRSRGHDASYTLCADFSDLPIGIQAHLLRLHPLRDLEGYAALRQVRARLTAPYSVADVASAAAADVETAPLALRIENLGIDEWTLWRRPGEISLSSVGLRDERCAVVDLGSLPEPDSRTAVAFVMLANRWSHRHERRPSLIAIDEAHNILPATTDDALLAATNDLGVLIAGEGRKFGLHLFVATQRPDKVHPNVVSQCDNLVLMRMNGQADIEDLVGVFSHVPAGLLRQASGFGLGQALVAGPISPLPQLVQIGDRLTAEGGADVPTKWTNPPT